MSEELKTAVDPTLIKVVSAAFAGLVAALGIVWRYLFVQIQQTENDLKETTRTLNERTNEIIKLTGEVGEFRGKFEGIEALSSRVIQEIQRIPDKVEEKVGEVVKTCLSKRD